MSSFPEHTVLKTVPLRFAGVDLKLKTSHALFSGAKVDEGTMLLLKTLAQQGVVPESGRVLDAGCGYGPLALALKKSHPGLTVVARDRLVLAAAYTAENARINGLEVDAAPGLLLSSVPGPFDLIVSNVPAKAGEPVLADFVARTLSLLSPGGRAAVVLVEPLAEWFSAELDRAGGRKSFEEGGLGYRVFHYQSPSDAVPLTEPPFPQAYRRTQMSWSPGKRPFVQKTFYGLPNFDALDYRLQLTLGLLEGLTIRGETLVWEPVQGHLATWADAVLGPQEVLHLAGNDLLGLLASRENVLRRTPVVHPVTGWSALDLGPGSLGAALVQLHPEPEIPWVDETMTALLRLLAPGATVVINGSSTDLTRLLERHKGLRKVKDVRGRGWRAVLLERQSPI